MIMNEKLNRNEIAGMHTLLLSRVETNPQLLQRGEEGLQPPHLEKRVVLILGERICRGQNNKVY